MLKKYLAASLLVFGLPVVTVPLTAAPAQADHCREHSWDQGINSDWNNAFEDSRHLRSNPYLECNKRAELKPTTDVVLHCFTVNDHGVKWVHIRAKEPIGMGGWAAYSWFTTTAQLGIDVGVPRC